MTLASPIVKIGAHRLKVDVPVLAFATALAGWAAWFGLDARHAAPDVENLILILPAVLAALAVYLFVIASCLSPAETAGEAAPERPPLDRTTAIRIAGSMVLLVGLVTLGPMTGFDVVSFVYMLAMLLLLGERRPLVLLLAPLLLTALIVFGFNKVLATPLPMVFFHEAA